MSKWDTQTAEWYAARYGEYATNRLAVDRLKLPVDAVVVDIGCGTGAALRHAARVVTQGALVGVDPVPRMIEIAKERSQDVGVDIRYLVGTADTLPMEDHSADFVFAFDSMDHWEEVQQGLREVGRILTSDGRFVIVKDASVPDSRKFGDSIREVLEMAEFDILEAESCAGEGVRFGFWLCAVG